MTGHDHHGHDGHGHSFDTEAEAARLEREAEQLLDLVEHAASVVGDLCEQRGLHVGRVLDVGCGPGVGTCVLAQRFAAARVVAVDSSPIMLERASARAGRLGLASRVETRRVDIPGGLDALGPADVVWASMVLHHVGDEAAALRSLRMLLAPDGLLAVVEHAPVPAVLDDAGFDVVIDEPLGTERRLTLATPTP